MLKKIFALFIILSNSLLHAQSAKQVDICVYGGTSAGVIAAYTAKMMGKTVLLIEPTKHVGGLTTGGLGYTDIGNKYAITGLSLDFYRRIGQHYGKFEQWIFEPSVAENIFQDYIKRAKVEVLYQYRLVSVKKQNTVIQEIVIENSDKPQVASNRTIKAKMFIDCSYEGDLMAKAGVKYFVGREANALHKETYNGVQVREKHQFPDGIDPYKIKGNSESGLLWGISAEPLEAQGTGDKKMQAYNFRICLSKDKANQIEITQPDNYDATRYELLIRLLEKEPNRPFNLILKPDGMPNQKTDINNNGPFSTDMIGMNYNYAEADYDTRKEITKKHEEYIKGLLYFIGHEPRMPAHLREEMLKHGYPKDEYTDNGNWSPQLYVREARRMVGAYVMTQANCEGREVVTDGVGMAAYTMDSHNCQRVVVNGMVKNEGDVQVGGFGPYPVSYRAIIPKATECNNLFVPVCLSATHIAYGSIRMEPVFMVLGQSSAMAAAMAIDVKTPVQKVDVKKLQNLLKTNPLVNGSTPDILVDNDDKNNVILTGNWKPERSGSYGPSLFSDDSKGATPKSARFVTNIMKSGKYKIYTYFPKTPQATTQTTFTVFDGQKAQEVIIKTADVQVEGQTSGKWIQLGEYIFTKGSKSYVEITNKNADGIIVADAVLLVPNFSK